MHTHLYVPAVVAVLAIATEAAADAGDPNGFDRVAAVKALSAVDLKKCVVTNAPHGEGHVMITFAPKGNATKVVVDRAPFAGTPAARCIGEQYKLVKVPSFTGEPIQVGKLFRVP
jgi:hypothetical protein